MRIVLAMVAIMAPAAVSAAPAPASPAAARLAIARYYAAIERRDYRAAYAGWARGGAASGQSYAAFRAGFARTAHSRVTTFAPTNQEGAAGSVFIDVPVDVRATLKTGVRQHFRGRYTLRRVNDVDGATAAQRTWHIEAAKLVAVR